MNDKQSIEIDENAVRQEIFGMVGASDMPPEAQDAVLAAASGPILHSVTLAVLLALPDDVRESFTDAIDKNDGETIQRIIAEHIPDSTTFIGKEVRKAAAEFRKLFEEEMKA